jgi:hypothetical protein
MSAPLTVADASSPPWETITEEIACPLCAYNLRGLTTPRCPECGFAFEWPQLLHRNEFIHPFLFEHHPERNVWSFRKTIFAGLRPFKFWRSVSPAHEPVYTRLMQYWLLTIALLLLSNVAVFFSWEVVDYRQQMWSYKVQMTFWNQNRYAPQTPAMQFDFRTWRSTDACPPWAVITAIAIAWPWLTLLTLLIFQQTMKRSRIRNIQVLRCIVYSSDATLWLALLLGLGCCAALGSSLITSGQIPNPRIFNWMTFPVIIADVALPIIIPFRLFVAYRNYLRFKHAAGTIISSQIIVALLIIQAMVLIYYA